MNLTAMFWNIVAKGYSNKPIDDEAAYQKKLQVTREYFRQDMEVLEFGCGTGSTSIAHAPYVKSILAIDVSPKMLEIAQGKADAKNIGNVTFKRSAIDSFNAPNNTLDAVLGLSILHLLDNKEEVIAKVHEMLKPGGIFITSTVCIGNSMKLSKFILPIGKIFGLIIKAFSAKELEDCLTEAGFKIVYQMQSNEGSVEFIIATKAESE